MFTVGIHCSISHFIDRRPLIQVFYLAQKILLMNELNKYFFPTVNIKYNAATPNMHIDPKIGATPWQSTITIIGGLKISKI